MQSVYSRCYCKFKPSCKAALTIVITYCHNALHNENVEECTTQGVVRSFYQTRIKHQTPFFEKIIFFREHAWDLQTCFSMGAGYVEHIEFATNAFATNASGAMLLPTLVQFPLCPGNFYHPRCYLQLLSY